ncbi:MAG: TIGR03067 domain-containing protein [Gemmataceae bacterium]|nr:TIGR03067 domain-containing protein [Gemmataceae bacterium]
MTRFLAAGVAFVLAVGGVVLADEKALKELAGKYQAVAVSKAGKDAPDEFVKGVTATVAGDELTITSRGKENRAKIAVDSTKKPAQIDISPADGPEKGKSFLGIYKLDKGEWTLVFTEKGDRPKEFKGGDEVVLIRFKKADGK